MSALGFLLVGFGILTVWSGFYRVNVLDVLRAIMANPTPAPGTKPGAPGHPVTA